MTSAQLQAFVTVAQANSFTAAAIMLGIGQSAVSHAIKSIEKELGITLFVRGKADIVLTEVGANILTKAHSVLGLFDSIKQTANESKSLQQGVLRIGSFGPSFSTQLLPIILAEYRVRYPNIKVYVEEGEDHRVKEWITNRKVDLGCVILPETDLEHIYLTTDKLSVVLPTNHPLTVRTKINIRELCQYPFILTEGTTGIMVKELFKQSKFKLDIRYNNVQIMSMLSMVSGGAGVSISADLAIPSELEGKAGSYLIKPMIPVVKREIGLAMQNMHHLSPAAAAFVKIASKLERAGKLIHKYL
ncbi:MAG: DNA-binding transcriptional LysR family regulator [Paraglaciecola sp.]|jgi:DNA-binding transcriptional LysR family regulator